MAQDSHVSESGISSEGDASAPGTPLPVKPAAVGDQQVVLLDIKSQLVALETQIKRAERRVAVLKEGVLGGPIAATNVVLVHRNEVGGPFVLDQATYALDGNPIFTADNSNGKLETQKIVELFNGGLESGPHQLRVTLEFRGRAVGPFTYLEGYAFRVKSGCNFEVVEGRSHRIDVVASASSDASLAPAERLSVHCDVDGHSPLPGSGPQDPVRGDAVPADEGPSADRSSPASRTDPH